MTFWWIALLWLGGATAAVLLWCCLRGTSRISSFTDLDEALLEVFDPRYLNDAQTNAVLAIFRAWLDAAIDENPQAHVVEDLIRFRESMDGPRALKPQKLLDSDNVEDA